MATKPNTNAKGEPKGKKLKLSRETLKDLTTVNSGDVKGGFPPVSRYTQCGGTPDCYKPNPY